MKAKLKWQEYNEWFKKTVSQNGANCSFTPDAIIEVNPIEKKNGQSYVSAKETDPDGIHSTFADVPEIFIEYRVFRVAADSNQS